MDAEKAWERLFQILPYVAPIEGSEVALRSNVDNDRFLLSLAWLIFGLERKGNEQISLSFHSSEVSKTYHDGKLRRLIFVDQGVINGAAFELAVALGKKREMDEKERQLISEAVERLGANVQQIAKEDFLIL